MTDIPRLSCTFYLFVCQFNLLIGWAKPMAKLKQTPKSYPNTCSCISLFSILAVFLAIFLALPITSWDSEKLSIWLYLLLVLQLVALCKAIYISWLLTTKLGHSIYLFGAGGSSLIMWLAFEGLIGESSSVVAIAPLVAMPAQIAVIDGAISVILLYRLKRWKKLIYASEPEVLSSQIRYHFLFNALNTTVYLIASNPRLAEINLGELAELFRIMLHQDNTVSLKEELDTVKRYLRIEQRRLENRMKVRWALNYAQSDTIMLPALLLQPLVENAIYHGVEEVIGGGVIMISISTHQKRLLIKVCNPVNDENYCSRRGSRLAHTNIERRLVIRYGKDFSFTKERYGKEYRVTIDIPKEEKP